MTMRLLFRKPNKDSLRLLPLGFLSLFLLMLLQPAAATITVMDSGQEFASKPDAHYGPLLARGYEYEAHLQYIAQRGGRFIDLCPPTDANYETPNFNISIVVPPFPDVYGNQVPVALLAQTGRCSLAEKLQFIQDHIVPSSVVKYLIVERRSTAWMNDEEEYTDEDTDDDNGFGPSTSKTMPRSLQDVVMVHDELLYPNLRPSESHLHRQQHRDDSIPITVLHVTPRSLTALWNTVSQQSESIRQEGGPRITMDARLGYGAASSIWVAFAALSSACCCSFLLACGQRGGWLDPDDLDTNQNNAPPANTRQPRRRLTREQVKRIFPIYRFNGTSLEAIPDAAAPAAAAATSPSTRQDELTQGLLSGPDLEMETSQTFAVPQPLELHDCSICLDDYHAGDRLRCLEPCNHAFHAKCIGKWLAERSATCPLCKTELWDPQEEEEDDESDDENDGDDGIVDNNVATTNAANNNDPGAQYFFGSQLASWVTLGNTTRTFAEESGTAVTQEGTASEAAAPNATTDPWWRRLFSSRQSPATVEMLTEPLLVSTSSQEAAAEVADPEAPLQRQQRPDPAADTSSPPQQQQQQPATAVTAASRVAGTETTSSSSTPVVENASSSGQENTDDQAAAADDSDATAAPVPDPPGAHSRQVTV